MSGWNDWAQFIISGATLVGLAIAVYKFSRDPDVNAEKRICILEKTCNIRKEQYDKNTRGIDVSIRDIQENHLAHIERDISDVKGDVKAILAVLKIK